MDRGAFSATPRIVAHVSHVEGGDTAGDLPAICIFMSVCQGGTRSLGFSHTVKRSHFGHVKRVEDTRRFRYRDGPIEDLWDNSWSPALERSRKSRPPSFGLFPVFIAFAFDFLPSDLVTWCDGCEESRDPAHVQRGGHSGRTGASTWQSCEDSDPLLSTRNQRSRSGLQLGNRNVRTYPMPILTGLEIVGTTNMERGICNLELEAAVDGRLRIGHFIELKWLTSVELDLNALQREDCHSHGGELQEARIRDRAAGLDMEGLQSRAVRGCRKVSRGNDEARNRSRDVSVSDPWILIPVTRTYARIPPVLDLSSERRMKTGFACTDTIIDKIIRITVQTGMLTNFIRDFPLSKLYSNCLISSLTARRSWNQSMKPHLPSSTDLSQNISLSIPAFGSGQSDTVRGEDSEYEIHMTKARIIGYSNSRPPEY
ncbi:hypothetical protein DFH09DRAFT_1087343 [Mycena vulgaris]|nr:hypothetical protein DFH09DRAFT_1087343 [Mycena vulgaris]